MLPVRMKRPDSRQLTRRRLFEAAGEVFSRRGFHAATLDQIAEAAGFSKGAVYSNFSSKEQLFLALLDERLAAETSAWQELRAKPGSNLLAFLQAAGLVEGRPEQRAWNLLLIEFSLFSLQDEAARTRLAERTGRLRAILEELLEQHFAVLQQPPPMPPTRLSRLLLTLNHGMSIQNLIDPGALPLAEFEEILDGILKLETRRVKEDGKKNRADGKKHKSTKKHKERKKMLDEFAAAPD